MQSHDFTSDSSFVLEVRPSDAPELGLIRCAAKQPLAFVEAMGKRVLLHAPRHEKMGGYFGTARIDSFEIDPHRTWTFVFLEDVEIFDHPVSTSDNGRPRENAPIDINGKPAFSFYANGLRDISHERFNDILAAAGSSRVTAIGGLAEPLLRDHVTVSKQAEISEEDRVVGRYRYEQRRVRARLRAQLVRGSGAFCCMSGASFDLPDSFSLLQLSHFWPLGRGGPDMLTNVGFMTGNIHPIYENGLVTIRKDFSLRFAPDIPPGFLAEFRGRTQMTISGNSAVGPAEENLAFHREEVFLRRLKARGLATSDPRFA